MFTLKVENQDQQQLSLSGNESRYQIVNIKGLNPPKANIFTHEIANMDGEKFKSSKLEMRNIVITVKINGNVEENRVHLYEYFRTGQWCKLYYSNDSRNVYIEGYCENMEMDLFVINQEMQISIVCPDPYLKSMRFIYADISKTIGNFEFPFDIEEEGIEFTIFDNLRITTLTNGGEVETGIKITLTAINDDVSVPIIYNSDTMEYMKLNTTIAEGEVVVINTQKGSKSIKKIANGLETNIINSLDDGSTWLQMKVGINRFTYSTSSNDGNLRIEFESNVLYEGV